MKRLTLFLLAAFAALCLPLRQARAEVQVSLEFFYDALDPYGDWVYVDDYGYCWQPEVAYEDDDWRPYADGYWAWTDAGWTWVSHEEFGWATYHYGRWILVNGRWAWVPGYEWAPAWVSWRTADECVGWAPLPPEARWHADIGFSTWTDSYYDIGPGCWNFVTWRHFAEPRLRPHMFARSRNVIFINASVNVTRIVRKENVFNRIWCGGPELDRVRRLGGRDVRHLTLRRDDDFRPDFRRDRGDDDRDRRGHRFSRVEGDRFVVAAPEIRREERIRPPEVVRHRFERSVVDRGWKVAGDRDALQRLRERFNRDERGERPKNLPPKPARPAIANAPVPDVPASKPGDIRRPDRPNRGEGNGRGSSDNVRPAEPVRPTENTPPRADRDPQPPKRPDVKPIPTPTPKPPTVPQNPIRPRPDLPQPLPKPPRIDEGSRPSKPAEVRPPRRSEEPRRTEPGRREAPSRVTPQVPQVPPRIDPGNRPDRPTVRPEPKRESRPEPRQINRPPQPKPEVRRQPERRPEPQVRREPERRPEPRPQIRREPAPKPEVRREPVRRPEVRPQPQAPRQPQAPQGRGRGGDDDRKRGKKD